MNIPQQLQKFLKSMKYTIDDEGMSSANVCKFTSDKETFYMKSDKCNKEFSKEMAMYRWLSGKLPLPEIISKCSENDIDYMLMRKADGDMVQTATDPELLVKLASDAVKMLWNVDITDCPFDSTIETKLQLAKEQIESGQVDDIEDNEYTEGLITPDDVYDFLVKYKPQEEYVFVHGDLCLNNFFFNKDKVTGFIDLGRAGVGDKWQDIALLVRELEKRVNKKYISVFFEWLGIKPNYEKIKYYILLDELF